MKPISGPQTQPVWPVIEIETEIVLAGDVCLPLGVHYHTVTAVTQTLSSQWGGGGGGGGGGGKQVGTHPKGYR